MVVAFRRDMKKKSAVTLLKIAVIAICLVLLSRKLDLGEIGRNLSHARLACLLPALGMILCEPLVMALKWDLLLRQKKVQAGFFALVRLIFVSNFLSVAFPTALAADALRLGFLRQQKHSLTHATATLLADRVIALATLVILSLAGLPFVWRLIAGRHVLAAILCSAAVLLAAIVVLGSELPSKFCRAIQQRMAATARGPAKAREALQRLAGFAENIHASARSLAAAPRLLCAVFLLNVVVQALRILQIHFLFRSLGQAIPLFQELVFVPLIIMLSLLPISYFGLGVKEGAFAYFFSSVGIPVSVSVSVSLITYPLIAAGLLPGAVFFAMQPRKERPRDVVAS